LILEKKRQNATLKERFGRTWGRKHLLGRQALRYDKAPHDA
jgi:hypothetical protein